MISRFESKVDKKNFYWFLAALAALYLPLVVVVVVLRDKYFLVALYINFHFN